MAQKENAPAVCFSPNAAIQMQWLSRLKENWVCLDDALGGFQPHPICGDEITDPDQVLISLTYQRISVRDKEGNPHPNVLRLFEALKAANIKTVILDECHHLSAVWGRAVQSLCEYLDRPCVIGLTATPVIQEEGPLNDLLGEADHEISLPLFRQIY